MDDMKLAKALHGKFYSDIPENEFYKKIGISSEEPEKKQTFGQKALRYGVQDPLAGLAQLGHGVLNAPHNLASLFSDKLASYIPKQEEFDFSEALGIPENEKNMVDRAIQFAPELGAAFALPAANVAKIAPLASKLPAVGRGLQSILGNKYGQAALGNALTQGLFAASQAPESQLESGLEAGGIAAPFAAAAQGISSGNPLARQLSRALLGAGTGALAYEGTKGVTGNDYAGLLGGALGSAVGYRGLNAKRRALEDMTKGIEGTDYKNALEAAERLGLEYLTPAEASGNPFTGALQGNIGKTQKGAETLYNQGQKRAASEQRSIENLKNTVFNPKELDTKMNELYTKSRNVVIPEESLAPLMDNEIFKSASQRVMKDPAYRESLKNVDESSIEYLDQVKKKLDDMIEKSPKERARLIRNTKKELVDILDNASPEYQEARALAERKIARTKIEDVFDKKAESGTNFGKFLESDKTFNKLKYSLRNVPEAQSQLDDMHMIFKRLINIPTAKAAEAINRNSMAKDRSDLQGIMRSFQELISGKKYDKAAVDIITNPAWSKELDKLSKITNTEKFLGGAMDMFGKALAQSVAQRKKSGITEKD